MVKTVGFLLVLSMTFPANTGSAQSCSQDAAIRNRPAAVFIRVKKTLKATGQVQERTGTGFLISRSGYVLTNRHVIEADETVDEIEISGFIASREAVPSRLTVIARNEHDVALLKFADTSKTYATVTLGRPSDVKVGTELCSVSFPKNQEYYFSSGPMSGFGAERGFWLTQMASNPGDSGAPVFTASGEVVAIKFGGYGDMQNVNLLIPMNLAQDLLILVPDLDTGSESQSHNHASQSNEQGCDSFLKFQGDESALALLGEKAFAQQKYECVITYLEQAKKGRTVKGMGAGLSVFGCGLFAGSEG